MFFKVAIRETQNDDEGIITAYFATEGEHLMVPFSTISSNIAHTDRVFFEGWKRLCAEALQRQLKEITGETGPITEFNLNERN